MRILFIVCYLISTFGVSASLFPGLPPDCWTKPRAFHNGGDTKHFISQHISITKNTEKPLTQFENVSPNDGYSFSRLGFRPNVTITIDAEKEHLTVIELKGVFGVPDIKWVNENLLFFRVYLGQEVFIDVLFQVELEAIIWSAQGRFSKSAMQQFEEGCKLLGGCDCIKRQEGSLSKKGR